MVSFAELVAALERIEAAETQLDELAAVDALWDLVDQLRRDLIVKAVDDGYTRSEIGTAAGGVTKQAIDGIYKRARRTDP